ncbi:MAG TPA: hypothetical protein VF072_15240, partial [Thermoleophilaceae bacterium]
MPPASQSREEERRLNTRTLTIASVASATAAAVTSQLWIAGTWIAAALTPVLVAVISEALHRPTERVARAWTAEREPRSMAPQRAQTATRAEPAAVTGSAGPVRVYRQTSRGVSESERGRPTLSGSRIPWRAVLLTAAAAFVIAVATITVIDLASSGSVNTTPLGRSGASHTKSGDQPQGKERQSPAEQSTTTEQTPTTTQPEEQQTAPSDTAPATP